jgi:hypothetical protein
MSLRYRLWRDGLLLAAAIIALGFYGLSTFGFETGWILESRNGAPVDKGAVDLSLHKPSSRGALLAIATPNRHRGRFTLRTPCGDHQGRYGRFFGRIEIDKPARSWGCEAVDADLVDTFQRTDRYRLGDAQLILSSRQGDVLVFRRAEWPLGLAPSRPRITRN